MLKLLTTLEVIANGNHRYDFVFSTTFVSNTDTCLRVGHCPNRQRLMKRALRLEKQPPTVSQYEHKLTSMLELTNVSVFPWVVMEPRAHMSGRMIRLPRSRNESVCCDPFVDCCLLSHALVAAV